MKKIGTMRTFAGLGIVLAAACVGTLAAEHEREGRGRGREREDEGEGGGARMTVATNRNYSGNCGVCHMAYPPGLLPYGSWEKIVTNMKKHNGEEYNLDPKDQQEILAFLKKNAADNSNWSLSRKIMQSLQGETPTRITDIPMIKRKHQKFSDEVFKRKGIGSRSNCAGCHQGAEKGIIDEDHIRIPKATPPAAPAPAPGK